MKFVCANELSFDVRPQMSHIFVEGFYSWIKYFSKDKEKLKKTFKHIFDLEYFYVAITDEEKDEEKIVAMVASTPGHAPITLQRKEMTKVLGYIKGSITYYILKKHMVRNSYPFTLSPKTGTIEFVATHPDYQGKGIAFNLITFTMNEANKMNKTKPPFTSYILEVADTNANAVHLYKKLEFREIKRVKSPNPKRSGVNYFLYMRREME